MANRNNDSKTIAQAYVQILPSTEGIEGSLTELLGGVSASAGSISAGMFGLSFASTLINAVEITAAGAEAIAKGLFDLGKQSLEYYEDYEQLVGGVETLFKDSTDAVLQYANNAYQTAGLSANEYMETVTGFSAALIQATGRGAQTDLEELESSLDAELLAAKRNHEDQLDELKRFYDQKLELASDADEKKLIRMQRDEAIKELKRSNEDSLAAMEAHNRQALKEAEAANNASVATEESLARAAELSDQAIIDMADNANKMGSSMESIQNAYQGFAKQNYTMLDNLKLGYGGTKEEMERLLADAEALSGIHYSLGNFADIVEAIHVVQTEMGITGTTAREAASTISGSLSMVESSWQNLLRGIADENADLDKLIDQFLASTMTAWDNLEPRVEQILSGLSYLISQAGGKILPLLLNRIIEDLPQLAECGAELIGTLIRGILGAIPQLIGALPKILQALWRGIVGGADDIRDAGDKGITQPLLESMDSANGSAYEMGGSLIASYSSGMSDEVDAANTAAHEVADSIYKELDVDAFAGRSGSFDESVPYGMGSTLIQEYEEGMLSEESNANTAAQSVTISAYLGLSNDAAEKASYHAGQSLAEMFAAGMSSKQDEVNAVALSIAGSAFRAGDGFSGRGGHFEDTYEILANYDPYEHERFAPDGWAEDFIRAREDLFAARQKELEEDALQREIERLAKAARNGYLYSIPTESSLGNSNSGAQFGHQQQTVILELDRTQLGRAVYELNNDEVQRVGLNLAGGIG